MSVCVCVLPWKLNISKELFCTTPIIRPSVHPLSNAAQPGSRPSCRNPHIWTVHASKLHQHPATECKGVTSSEWHCHWPPLTLPALCILASRPSRLGCALSMMSPSRLPRRLYSLAEIRRKGSDVICRWPRGEGGSMKSPSPSPPPQQPAPAEVPDAHLHQRRRSRQCQRQWLTMTADTDNLCKTQSGAL